MPAIPLILAALLSVAEFIFGEVAVEAAIAAALEFLGIEGGVTALCNALEAFLLRWTPEAIDTLEGILNPLPAAGGMAAAGTGAAADAFKRSAAWTLNVARQKLPQYSLKEIAIMKAVIELARKSGLKQKGASLQRHLIAELQAWGKFMAQRAAAAHSQVPNGITSFALGEWMPFKGAFWSFYRQADGVIAIQKVAAINVSKQALEQAARTALQSLNVIQSNMPPKLLEILEQPGVRKFLRLLANGEMAVVYEAPGCGDVVITISKTVQNAQVNSALIQQSMWRYHSLWR